MQITVVGMGYVGLVTSAALAYAGHNVICLDINQERVVEIKNGNLPFFEPYLDELINFGKNKLLFSCDFKEAFFNPEIIIIAVGTPEGDNGTADLNAVYTVAKQIAETITENCVIVIKSTVPAGTCDLVEKLIKSNLKKNVLFDVVSNPEFLSQGTAVRDVFTGSRIVIGYKTEWGKNEICKMYSNFNVPIITTNRCSAEMIKYASNCFLAVKLSFINEIANLCEKVGADIAEVSKGMGYDNRIGDKYLEAGIGYGGSCLPKDTKALCQMGKEMGCELKTIEAAIHINAQQQKRLLYKAHKYYEELENRTVAVLGLSFKANTDDLRYAPSVINITALIEEGAFVKVWDPIAIKAIKTFNKNVSYCNSIKEALHRADLCFIFVDWEEIKNLDPSIFAENMKAPIILDGRNCFNLDIMNKCNIIYDSIGRNVVNTLL